MVETFMAKDFSNETTRTGDRNGKPPLSPAAERALAEAAARRAEIDARVAALPPELGARREREPVRYGDWETKGVASDF
jgi:hypothetical protein